MTKRIVYKLTNQNGRTRNNTQWGPNITHEAIGALDQGLCSNAWIHAYESPLVAILRNPQDANFKNPLLWEAIPKGKRKIEALKCGFRKLTTVKQIPLPQFTIINIVAWGILCAKIVYKETNWNLWADDWLNNKNRTVDAAAAAASAAHAAAIHAAHAANAAHAAVAIYAANAADAADAAANAAAAVDAADAAANAAHAAAAVDAAGAAHAADAAHAAAAAAASAAHAAQIDFHTLALRALEVK
jgi:hypothetical protein